MRRRSFARAPLLGGSTVHQTKRLANSASQNRSNHLNENNMRYSRGGTRTRDPGIMRAIGPVNAVVSKKQVEERRSSKQNDKARRTQQWALQRKWRDVASI